MTVGSNTFSFVHRRSIVSIACPDQHECSGISSRGDTMDANVEVQVKPQKQLLLKME